MLKIIRIIKIKKLSEIDRKLFCLNKNKNLIINFGKKKDSVFILLCTYKWKEYNYQQLFLY